MKANYKRRQYNRESNYLASELSKLRKREDVCPSCASDKRQPCTHTNLRGWWDCLNCNAMYSNEN